MNEENEKTGSLFSGQEPHQKEDFDQAEKASTASFTLEPDRGITPDPEDYNHGDDKGNIKEKPSSEAEFEANNGPADFDPVNDDVDLDADEFDVTGEDLDNLDAMGDEEDGQSPV